MNNKMNKIEYLYLGIPTWCLVNGTYGILYILVDKQPEGYTMSSYLVLCLTLGNIVAVYAGLFCEAFLYKYLIPIIYGLLWFGFLTSSLLALCWHITIANLSVPLFVCFFSAGACAATSNVVLFTFVSIQMNKGNKGSSNDTDQISEYSSSNISRSTSPNPSPSPSPKTDPYESQTFSAINTKPDVESDILNRDKHSNNPDVVIDNLASQSANETVLLATGIGIGTMVSGMLVLFVGLVMEPFSHVPSNTLISLFYGVLALIYIRALVAFYNIVSAVVSDEIMEENIENKNVDMKVGSEHNAVHIVQHGSHDGSTLNEFPYGNNNTTSNDNTASNNNNINNWNSRRTRSSRNSRNSLNSSASKHSKCSCTNRQSSECYDPLPLPIESEHQPLALPHKLPCIHQNLLILMFVTGIMGFGVIPSIISTVCGLFKSANSVLFYATSVACLVDPFGRMHTHYYQLRTMNEFYWVFGLICAVTGIMILFLCLPSNTLIFHSGIWCALPALMYILFIYLFGFLSTSVFNYINVSHHGEIIIIDRNRPDYLEIISNHSSDSIDSIDSTSSTTSQLLNNPKKHQQTIHDLSRLCSVALQAGAVCGTFVSFSVFMYLSQ